MPKIIHRAEQEVSQHGTVAFEGEAHGSGVSMYVMSAPPGHGPPLHTHPYPETWVIHSGRALISAGGTETIAGAGAIGVCEAGMPHKFKALGPERLEIVCIHASPVFLQEDLE